MGVTFGDFPLRLTAGDYELSVSRYVESAKLVSDEISVFWYGSVKAPGLSDIDLLCIVPDELPGLECRRLVELASCDPLFAHGPTILPRSMISSLPWVSPGGCYRHVGGPPHELDGKHPAQALHLASVIEGGMGRWIRLSQSQRAGLLRVRSACITMWTISHMVESSDAAAVEVPDSARAFVAAMARLRTDWAQAQRIDTREVVALLDDSLPILADLINRAASAFVSRSVDGTRGQAMETARELHVNRSVLLAGMAQNGISYCRKTFSFAGKSRGYDLLALPSATFQYYLSKSMGFPGKSDSDGALRTRARVIGRHTNFLRQRGLPYDRMDGQGRRAVHWLGRTVDQLAQYYLSRNAARLFAAVA